MPKPSDIKLAPASDQYRLSIVVDTREQRPWHFPEDLATVKRGTLDYGDYALEGDHFAIERKSLDDFAGTVSSGWERFCRELDRMQIAPARVVFVEATLGDIWEQRHNHKNLSAKFLFSRIADLQLMGIGVMMCDNPVFAAAMAYRFFRKRMAHLTGAPMGAAHG